MNNVFVLSDDLTGANDSGVQFAKRGIPTTVYINDSGHTAHSRDGSAHVINMESRSLSVEEAFDKWQLLREMIDWRGSSIVFKKIDSTLRGNIGIELQALMDIGSFDIAIVAPAYPDKGRITIGGYQMVYHQLLQDTEMAKDPQFPITNSKIAEIIRQQTNLPIAEVNMNTVRDHTFQSTIEQMILSGTRIIIVDSVMREDLERIVDELEGRRILWVGSSGLAHALSMRYPLKPFDRYRVRKTTIAPIFVAAGSVSGVTKQQVEHLLTNGFEMIKLDPVILLSVLDPIKQGDYHIRIEEYIRRARDTLASGKHLVISIEATELSREQVSRFLSSIGSLDMNVGNVIADQMGMIAAKLIASEQLSGCVLTGGDIAYRTCLHLGIKSLRIIGEVEEGLPICIAEEAIDIPVVTKAGAFGKEDSLLRAGQAMMNLHLSIFGS